MRFVIKHEIKGRLRVHILQSRMSFAQADTLQYYLDGQNNIVSAKIQERTLDVTVVYTGSREEALKTLENFTYQGTEVPENYLANSGREMNREYKDQLINKVVMHYGIRLFLPMDIRSVITTVKSFKYLWHGIKTLAKGKIEVPVLDATAIGVSVLRGDYNTAASVMFLLGIGEILEEWTHKKSVGDLARSMSLNIDKVWVVSDGQEILVPSTSIKSGDLVRIHMGNVIPFDGTVTDGEGMVNQASLTGESVPVRKILGGTVYAGTVVEEGELTICVKENGGSSKYEKIMTMIEESEKLKSSLEGKAEHLADKLVPYTFLGTGLVWLFTRNVTKALSVLMVDFSCALKLSMPLAVLSAIREASTYEITVKGGKYLEAMADATTIVFDKTGTLTKGEFKVTEMKPAGGVSEDKLLEVAALGESYSNHPIAGSIIEAYGKEIERSRVSDAVEIAGHGVQILVDGVMTYVGNEKLMKKQSIAYEPCESAGTVVYVGQEQTFLGALVISDTVKQGAAEAIHKMKNVGVKKCVMLTGDREKTAKHVADELKLDEVHAELLPGDKVDEVEKLLSAQKDGERLAFVGDGINDAPVLTRADIGIAMGSLGSDAAIEAADVVLMDDDIRKIASTVLISRKTLRIVKQNIVFALAVKAVVLLLGAIGVANMWEAVFADVGVSVLAILNSMRVMKNH